MAQTTVTDLRARLLTIVGQVKNIDLMLGDVSLPSASLFFVDHCTDIVSKNLQRLCVTIAAKIEAEKNNAGHTT